MTTTTTTRGLYLYLSAEDAPSMDVGAARLASAKTYAQWLEGGKNSQTDLAHLLRSLMAQYDALLDLAVASANTTPRHALHASRAAVLANAAAALSFPPVVPPFPADTSLLCECLAAAACVFASRGAGLYTAAALAKVCAHYSGRARGVDRRDKPTTTLFLFATYWKARAHLEAALATRAPLEELSVDELTQYRSHARLAMALVDASLANTAKTFFTAAAVDYSAFLRLTKEAAARDKELDQRLAYHQIRGLRLDNETATTPPATPPSELTLPVIDDAELFDFDTQFSTETLKARADMGRQHLSSPATAAPVVVAFEAARAQMLPLLLGAGADRILQRFGSGSLRVELALMRAWLAEQQRLGKVLLDTRATTLDWRQEIDALIKELDAALLRE